SSANANGTRVPGPCPKSGMAERDKLILGARAPSPAMSAKRETVTASRSLRLSVLRALRRARAPALPSTNRLVPYRIDFLGKPAFLQNACGTENVRGGASSLGEGLNSIESASKLGSISAALP